MNIPAFTLRAVLLAAVLSGAAACNSRPEPAAARPRPEPVVAMCR